MLVSERRLGLREYEWPICIAQLSFMVHCKFASVNIIQFTNVFQSLTILAMSIFVYIVCCHCTLMDNASPTLIHGTN